MDELSAACAAWFQRTDARTRCCASIALRQAAGRNDRTASAPSTTNASRYVAARIPFALARDRNFFPTLAEIDPKYQTPARAIIVQAIVAILLLLVGGAFKELFSLAIFSEWLFYMIATSTVFVFRARKLPRPFSAWGYPVVPALFIAAAGVLLYYTFFQNLRNSIIGLALILLGVPLYIYFQRKKEI